MPAPGRASGVHAPRRHDHMTDYQRTTTRETTIVDPRRRRRMARQPRGHDRPDDRRAYVAAGPGGATLASRS